ncbi:2OG-Fe(II) oxygenase [Hugenholtzia roseola]|uniref:2OG-Fe(II) oxygenase n=1 Tax=Hugenholtzia roseola TaxID=1002 RepID=UPI00041E2208|nr:2OG-Fe(II) oxygenase [Hugenholtzia roseola]
MQLINLEALKSRTEAIKADYQSKKPFRYVMFENFFEAEVAELVHQNYPTIADGLWDGTTYLDQKNKFQKTDFEAGSVMHQLFTELNSKPFLNWIQEISEIEEELIGDEQLFGGGLHQSINGAFLNVHVDYNIHPKTQFHRRLNVLVYMNKDWKDEYEGHLELWDLTGEKKVLLGKYAPSFNRCVIFETNEISFHGHPKPLKTPQGINRKSIATYYYTKERPAHEIAEGHNTIYVNTEGATGQVKRFTSGVRAFLERINKQ